MTQPPGFESPRTAKALTTHAPKAWHDFATQALVTLPRTLSESAALRRRLRRVRPR